MTTNNNGNTGPEFRDEDVERIERVVNIVVERLKAHHTNGTGGHDSGGNGNGNGKGQLTVTWALSIATAVLAFFLVRAVNTIDDRLQRLEERQADVRERLRVLEDYNIRFAYPSRNQGK